MFPQIEVNKRYKITNTQANEDDLRAYASLLPEGIDLFRADAGELEKLYNDGNIQHVDSGVLYQPTRRSVVMNDTGEVVLGKMTEPPFVDLSTELWNSPFGRVVAKRAIRKRRSDENFEFSDIWMFKLSVGVEGIIHVLPESITLRRENKRARRGAVVNILGRYISGGWEMPLSADKVLLDDDGWRRNVSIKYNFAKRVGTLAFKKP